MFFFKKCGRLHAVRVAKATGKKNNALKKLRSFLDTGEPQTVQWLVSFWDKQQAAVTYKELREAILSGKMTEKQLQKWQTDYSKLVNTKLAPQWAAAMASAAEERKKQYPYFLYDPSTEAAQDYIQGHGAELVTNLVAEQREAIQAMVAQASYYDGMTADSLSRIIRPVIGLTKPQAKSNLNHYNTVRNTLLKEHPHMTVESAEKKARDAAARYAARQHRYRAMNIARTELAAAYNQGAYGATKAAQEQGYIGDCKKTWLTADDERVCQKCGGIDGESVNMDAEFSNGVLIPPAHPQCRCAVAYEEVAPNLQPTAQSSIMVSEEIAPDAVPEPLTPEPEPKPKPAKPKPPKLKPEPEPAVYSRYSRRRDVPKRYSEKLMSLPEKQREALTYYTGSNYTGMNRHLRKGAAASYSDIDAIKEIDKAFMSEATELPANTTLFRGAHPSTLVGWDKLLKKPISSWQGEKLSDKGFVSTSIVEGSNFDKDVTLTIKAPQGAKGVFVAPISQFSSENEVLLNRGTSFRIDKAAQDERGRYYLEVTVIQDKEPKAGG